MGFYRLSQVARRLNCTKSEIVAALAEVGIEVDNNPNAKISSDQVDILAEALAINLVDNEESSSFSFFSNSSKFIYKKVSSDLFHCTDSFTFKTDVYERFEPLYKFLLSVDSLDSSSKFFYSRTSSRKLFSKEQRLDSHFPYLDSLSSVLDNAVSVLDKTNFTLNNSIPDLSKLGIECLSSGFSQSRIGTCNSTNKLTVEVVKNHFSSKSEHLKLDELRYEILQWASKREEQILSFKVRIKKAIKGLRLKKRILLIRENIRKLLPFRTFYFFTSEDEDDRVARLNLSLSVVSLN